MLRMKELLTSAVIGMALCGGMNSARAEIGAAARIGTFGLGADFDASLTDRINWRIGINKLNYAYEETSTDVFYKGDLEIQSFSAILAWHAFDGGLRLDIGAVAPGPKSTLTGIPTGNVYLIGNGVYSAAEIGAPSGELKFGNSIAPYLGLGWGNVVSQWHRGTLLVDVGVMYGGKPNISLSAACGPTIVNTPVCTQLQTDLEAEKNKLRDKLQYAEWYPVVSVGFGFRF